MVYIKKNRDITHPHNRSKIVIYRQNLILIPCDIPCYIPCDIPVFNISCDISGWYVPCDIPSYSATVHVQHTVAHAPLYTHVIYHVIYHAIYQDVIYHVIYQEDIYHVYIRMIYAIRMIYTHTARLMMAAHPILHWLPSKLETVQSILQKGLKPMQN